MTTEQNIIERIKDKLKRGLINADEANVQMIEDLRVRIVINTIDRKTRKALNEAVKAGRLGRLKREGLKPEAFYKTNFKYLAVAKRNAIEKKAKDSLKGMFA